MRIKIENYYAIQGNRAVTKGFKALFSASSKNPTDEGRLFILKATLPYHTDYYYYYVVFTTIYYYQLLLILWKILYH